MFSIKALRHAWRHGDHAVLAVTSHRGQVEATVVHVVRKELHQVPLIPEPEPESSEKLEPETATFCVFAEGKSVYLGASGGDARRVIEKLTSRGVEWEAFRHGEHWCRSPVNVG